METFKALTERRTIHQYEKQAVPAEALEKALKAAHFAPNHKLTFPWKFYVIGPESRSKIVEIVCLAKMTAVTEEMKASLACKFVNPGILVGVSCTKSSDEFRAREDYAAVSCAIQNFMVSLYDSGYGSKWSTGGFTRHPNTYQLLSIDSTKEELVGFIMGGVPAKVPGPIPRPPLEEHVKRIP